jgi:hypothetical protein
VSASETRVTLSDRDKQVLVICSSDQAWKFLRLISGKI